MEDIVGMDPRFDGGILPLLDIIIDEVGIKELEERVQKPLGGLKPVFYYGCLMSRTEA